VPTGYRQHEEVAVSTYRRRGTRHCWFTPEAPSFRQSAIGEIVVACLLGTCCSAPAASCCREGLAWGQEQQNMFQAGISHHRLLFAMPSATAKENYFLPHYFTTHDGIIPYQHAMPAASAATSSRVHSASCSCRRLFAAFTLQQPASCYHYVIINHGFSQMIQTRHRREKRRCGISR